MIVVNGHEFITLRDEFYVNGKRVYEAYANGIKVYPEGGGDTLFIVDHSGSMSSWSKPYNMKRSDAAIEVMKKHNFGKSYTLCELLNDYTMRVVVSWTTSFEEILAMNSDAHFSGHSFADPSPAIISTYEEYQPNSIVVISDDALQIGESERAALDEMMGMSNLYLINVTKYEDSESESGS